MTPEEIMDEIRGHLLHWQRELRLDGADVELRWMEKDEDHPDLIGRCDSESESSYFIISFRHPDHRQEKARQRIFNSDWEVVLVHELLHVRDDNWRSDRRIWKVLKEEVPSQVYEIAIDAVAEALVRARRGLRR